MNVTTEKRLARVQEASRIGLAHRMADREKKIIDRLVLSYRSNKLSSEMLFGGIATISELRSIINEAEHDIMQATDEVEQLTSSR